MEWTSTNARSGSFILTNPKFANIHISIFTGMGAALPHASNVRHSHHYNGHRYWTTKKTKPNSRMKNNLINAFNNWDKTKYHKQKPSKLKQLVNQFTNSNSNSNSNLYSGFRI